MKIEDIFKNFPQLETDRLLLRKLTEADVEDLYDYASQDKVTKYVPWHTHRSREDTQKFIAYALQQYKNHALAPWGIEYKKNGKLIGTIDFVSWQPFHHRAEIGYVLSPDYWGQGIMTEAGKRILAFGFEKMDLVRIYARCTVENTASARVMEKLGMSFEGILRKEAFIKGKHYDMKIYSILREEWASLHEMKKEY